MPPPGPGRRGLGGHRNNGRVTRVPISLLDLVLVGHGRTPAEAIAATVRTARTAETHGYARFWLAEHHNMRGVASSATAVLVGHVADHTRSIRVGAGGVMLPNHPPLVVAEQFGTLAAMHGDRIDLGLGRAPGTDPLTARALRRAEAAVTSFAEEVAEVRDFLGPVRKDAQVRAVPGEGTRVPIWVLGSSHAGASVAAHLGLPYSFASHFAPALLRSALEGYRAAFRPGSIEAPHTMAAANVMVADTEAQARRLFSSVLQRFHGIVTGRRGRLPEPTDGDVTSSWPPAVRAAVGEMVACSFVGTPGQVREGLTDFARHTGVDELIVTCAPYDPEDRLRSVHLLGEAWAA